ncbi:unnamed protein product, partial [Candidula unifasciata]
MQQITTSLYRYPQIIMRKNTWDLIFQLWLYVWLPVCRTDCPYMECYCNGRIVTCADRNLPSLPQLLSTNASIHWSLDIA